MFIEIVNFNNKKMLIRKDAIITISEYYNDINLNKKTISHYKHVNSTLMIKQDHVYTSYKQETPLILRTTQILSRTKYEDIIKSIERNHDD